MSIPFTCPHCGTYTSVDEQFAGHTGPCANCGNMITIPATSVTYSPGAVPPRRKSKRIFVGLIVVALFCCVGGPLLLAFLLPAVQAAREAARRVECSNNLKQIGIALNYYHDVYGCYPPAVITDEDGFPRYSWRVAILPFMEEVALSDSYDPNVSWDDPANAQVRMTVLPCYQCPSAERYLPNTTDYVMITGEGTVGGVPNEGTKLGDIADDSSNTILVVEIADSFIEWSEPSDLSIDELTMLLNDPQGMGPGSHHPGGLNVLFCDGSTSFISENLDAATLETMLRIDDEGGIGAP